MTYKRQDLQFRERIRRRAVQLGIYPKSRIGQMVLYIGYLWPRLGWKIWRLYR